MPRTKEKYAEMRDASNQKIKSAALKLFVGKGFAATSIDEIAEEAGLSKGMVYRHYKSKDDLFVSLIKGATDGLRQMTEGIEKSIDPKATMEGMVSHIYSHMSEGDDFLNLMMLVSQGLMGGTSAYIAVIDTNIMSIEAAAGLIKQGQELGVFGLGDPTEMSCFAFSFIQGLAMMKRALGDRFKMPSVEIMTSFLYRGITNE